MELKDVIHLYLGCRMQRKKSNGFTGTLLAINGEGEMKISCSDWWEGCNDPNPYLPILRQLCDMTVDEAEAHLNFNRVMAMDVSDDVYRIQSAQVVYLLSKHFDLFGLIPAGLAIDATTLKTDQQPLP